MLFIILICVITFIIINFINFVLIFIRNITIIIIKSVFICSFIITREKLSNKIFIAYF